VAARATGEDQLRGRQGSATWPARINYVAGDGRLTIECAAVMPEEQTAFSNELILSRATSPVDSPTSLDFSKIVNIHRDTQVVSSLHFA